MENLELKNWLDRRHHQQNRLKKKKVIRLITSFLKDTEEKEKKNKEEWDHLQESQVSTKRANFQVTGVRNRLEKATGQHIQR